MNKDDVTIDVVNKTIKIINVNNDKQILYKLYIHLKELFVGPEYLSYSFPMSADYVNLNVTTMIIEYNMINGWTIDYGDEKNDV